MNSDQYQSNTASKEAIVLVNAIILVIASNYALQLRYMTLIPMLILINIAPIISLIGVFNNNKGLINLGVVLSALSAGYAMLVIILIMVNYFDYYSYTSYFLYFSIIAMNIISLVFCTRIHPTAVPQVITGIFGAQNGQRSPQPNIGFPTMEPAQSNP